jgi:hypothetical protein
MDMVPDESLVVQESLILCIDIYRIEQVIRNLITNAVLHIFSVSCIIMSRENALSVQIKFTPRDGQVRVDISCKLFGSSDSHTAMREAVVDYLFVCLFDEMKLNFASFSFRCCSLDRMLWDSFV